MTDPLAIKEEALRLVHETEAREGRQRFIYKGKCMSPALRDEDLLLVKEVPARELRLGDIVLFRADGQLWVHRYLCRKKLKGKPDLLFTKADNTLKIDEPFTEKQLVGAVQESRRKNQTFRFKKGPAALLSSCIGFAALCEASAFTFFLKVRPRLQGKIRLPAKIKKGLGILAKGPKSFLVKVFIFLYRA